MDVAKERYFESAALKTSVPDDKDGHPANATTLDMGLPLQTLYGASFWQRPRDSLPKMS